MTWRPIQNPRRRWLGWHDWQGNIADLLVNPALTRQCLRQLERWRPEGQDWLAERPTCRIADIFGPKVPRWVVEDTLRLLYRRPDVTWLIVTEHPGRATQWFGPQHCWLGCVATQQRDVDRLVPSLMALADWPIKFVVVEPMAGPVRLGSVPRWVVCGGGIRESAASFERQWAVELLHETHAAGSAFWWDGVAAIHPEIDPELLGRQWREWPHA